MPNLSYGIGSGAAPSLKQGSGTLKARVREAQFEDYDQIAAVEARNRLEVKPREQWIRLWRENPAYRMLRRWPIGWVLEDAAGSIVGSIGNIPTLYHLNGRSYIGTTGRSWAVDSDYRWYSLKLLAQQFEQPNVDLIVAATANAQSAGLFSKLGWSRVPVGEWDRSALWVGNYTRTVRRYLESARPGAFAATAGFLLYPLLRLKDVLAHGSARGSRGLDLQWVETFGAPFDDFWHAKLERRPDILLASRSSEFLNWHYHSAHAERRLWILTASKRGQLVAYAILQRRDVRSVDLSRVLLIDYQSLESEPAISRTMLEGVLDRCRAEGVDLLENAGCWFAKQQPSGSPEPRYRDLDSWPYFYKSVNSELAGLLRDPRRWYPTQYDGDASL